MMESGGGRGVETQAPQAQRRTPVPVALDFPMGEPSSTGRIPWRVRRRLLEGRRISSSPSSVEEIEAKLREAYIRRQQFYEWLSNKARPKPKSPSWSSQEEDRAQRLEAKLVSAKQKRLNLLAKEQIRLAKLDELRQAAKSSVEKRFEEERRELGTRVKSRVQQAEANRMRLLKVRMQRRAAVQERKAKSLSQRSIRENKYRELVRSAILQKRAAAETKRMGLLESEKKRANAVVMQARQVANAVYHRRETERRKLKEQLEDRLQKAKRQRAEYLKQRGSPRSSSRMSVIKHGELLARKLARCWRHFVRTKKTTFDLARAFKDLGVNENSVGSMPFEQLAMLIESTAALETTKALLDRLESRFFICLSAGLSNSKNIDHLLKHLATPKRRVPPGRTARAKGTTRKGTVGEVRNSKATKLSRYPVRVLFCAYMILGHPNCVFSGQGESEVLLKESAIMFVREFELLIEIMLKGQGGTCSLRRSTEDGASGAFDKDEELSKRTFRSQLFAFDTAWCSYLYHFVVWKVKDARSLEDDLVRVACQLELSMMQTCKLTSESQSSNLSHDMQAIQKQVSEDQKLLREKVQHLSGDVGIERMKCALSDMRSKYFEAKDVGSPATPDAQISSPSTFSAPETSLVSPPLVLSTSEQSQANKNGVNRRPSNHVVRSLFGIMPSSSDPSKNLSNTEHPSTSSMERHSPTENELLVNEILHQGPDAFTAKFDVSDDAMNGIKLKVKEVMEKAFWDEIMDSLNENEPDYSRIIKLFKEIRDELCEMSPKSWKQEIFSSIDLEIISQILKSGNLDMDYLGKVLHYAFFKLQKLCAPAKEDEMRNTHKKVLEELSLISQSDDKSGNSFVVATLKGLHFVLEQIQELKKEVSKARIQLMEPILKGSAGLDYLQKGFADRYGDPSDAKKSLPVTFQWISTIISNLEEEWNDHINSRSFVETSHGVPLSSSLKSGGRFQRASENGAFHNSSDELPECKGDGIDKLVRLGLLKLASSIEGVSDETAPETLKLNVLRLRSAQSQLQQIIVIATSALVLRQILVVENPSVPASLLESAVSDTVKRLHELLERVSNVGIEEIVDTMISSSSSYLNASEAKLQSRKEMVARMLIKSLQNDDTIFEKVSRSIHLATRGLVLGGTGALGRKLADAALRRVGATMLLGGVVKVARVLITMALVTGHAHGPWYRCLM